MSIIYIVSLTEYAVQKNVITLVIIQINKNLNITPWRTSRYEMKETVDGIKSKGMFLSKKSETVSICSIFINLKSRHKNSKIMAITLPGKGMVRKPAITSPSTQRRKILKTCSNNFKRYTPTMFDV